MKKINFVEMLQTEKPDNWEVEVIVNQSTGRDSYTYIDVYVPKSISDRPNQEQKSNPYSIIDYWLKKGNSVRLYPGIKKDSEKIYRNSSSDKECAKAQLDPNIILIKYIVDWGTFKEMEQIEFEILNYYDAQNHSQFFNKWNGKPGAKKMRLEYCDKMVNEINVLRELNFVPLLTDDTETWDKQLERLKEKKWEILSPDCIKKPMSVQELYDSPKAQTRAMRIIRENHLTLVDKIDFENVKPSPNVKAVVIIQLGKKKLYNKEYYHILIISGNHTIEAYMDAQFERYRQFVNLPVVIIPEHISIDLSESEINRISNRLNTPWELGAPFTKQDAIKEGFEMHLDGNAWNTAEMKAEWRRNGLKGGVVDDVMKKIQQKIDRKEDNSKGWTYPQYNKHDKDLLEQQGEENFPDDDTFIFCTSLASIKPNELLVGVISKHHPRGSGFKTRNEVRISEGKKPYTKIGVQGYCNDESILKTWKDTLEPQMIGMWELANGEYPPISFEIAEQKMTSVIYKDKKRLIGKSKIKKKTKPKFITGLEGKKKKEHQEKIKSLESVFEDLSKKQYDLRGKIKLSYEEMIKQFHKFKDAAPVSRGSRTDLSGDDSFNVYEEYSKLTGVGISRLKQAITINKYEPTMIKKLDNEELPLSRAYSEVQSKYLK